MVGHLNYGHTGFLHHFGEIAQIVGGQHVGSMHIKTSDPGTD